MRSNGHKPKTRMYIHTRIFGLEMKETENNTIYIN